MAWSVKPKNAMKDKNKMITFASENTRPAIRRMWKTCFNDSEAFMDLYFSEKYRDENTLVYIENNQAVASLQMLPYSFTFYGEMIPVAYISGACTLPGFRHRGYMSQLLLASFEVMKQRNIPLSILIPADENLCKYYEKFGYEKVFEKDDEEIPLKEIWEKSNSDLDLAYQEFNQLFKDKDFCIQKTKADFQTIIKDAELDGFPPKTNLSGMARVITTKNITSFRHVLCLKTFKDFKMQRPILNLMLE